MILRHLMAAAAFAGLAGIGSMPITAANLEAELLIPSQRVVFGEEFPLTVEVPSWTRRRDVPPPAPAASCGSRLKRSMRPKSTE